VYIYNIFGDKTIRDVSTAIINDLTECLSAEPASPWGDDHVPSGLAEEYQRIWHISAIILAAVLAFLINSQTASLADGTTVNVVRGFFLIACRAAALNPSDGFVNQILRECFL